MTGGLRWTAWSAYAEVVLTELAGSRSFRMGSTRFYPEEAPIHTVTVRLYGRVDTR